MWQTARLTVCWLLPPLTVIAACGLLAIWAARSRRHWFVRAMPVCAAVLLFVPIRAYEPAAILALMMPLIVAAVAIQNRKNNAFVAGSQESSGAKRRLRFALRDLLLLVSLVATVLF